MGNLHKMSKFNSEEKEETSGAVQVKFIFRALQKALFQIQGLNKSCVDKQ